MIARNIEEAIRRKYQALQAELDERTRRLWAASESLVLGHGGVVTVAKATGLAESTIRSGRQELEQAARSSSRPQGARRVRQPGGGRKPLTAQDPALVAALEALVDPVTRGDPMSPLRWTCKSTRKLAEELTESGHPVSRTTVAQVLEALGYSLQGTRKTQEGTTHPDRNAQFEYINQQVHGFQRRGQPVVSVDAKKKELVGEFANAGREYQPTGQPERVRVYDFMDKRLGKANPYGVYDLTANAGWVSVGTDHDTAQFAVETLRRWWYQMGHAAYPQARELLITADGGGSNGSRSRLWKVELQQLADETGLALTVCHFPPGTSKWNKIEHRMFCHITQNWRGRPLISHDVIVNLIANTTTATGLRIHAALDTKAYPTGLKVPKEQMKELRLQPKRFHGQDWNYTIMPRLTKNR
jgi:Rhodopirellula transposase DDE domain